MTPTEIQSLLKPGDCLLYRPKPRSLFGNIIKFKNWHEVSHVEIYVGAGKSVASRDGLGVAQYPWRDSELAYVLRPTYPLDWAAFWKWFQTVNGQKYDWLGLLRFGWFKSIGTGDNSKMFCSEFAARAYRVLNAHVFADAEDADAIAPFQFLTSPNLTWVATPLSLR